jgi:hypothetical protein
MNKKPVLLVVEIYPFANVYLKEKKKEEMYKTKH